MCGGGLPLCAQVEELEDANSNPRGGGLASQLVLGAGAGSAARSRAAADGARADGAKNWRAAALGATGGEEGLVGDMAASGARQSALRRALDRAAKRARVFQGDLRFIEARYGSSVASYFYFLRCGRRRARRPGVRV